MYNVKHSLWKFVTKKRGVNFEKANSNLKSVSISNKAKAKRSSDMQSPDEDVSQGICMLIQKSDVAGMVFNRLRLVDLARS